MPYPSQIDAETILHEARLLLEAEGLAKLSLRVLAEERLGVKAPSLYRYFRNKQALLHAIAEQTVAGLFQAIYAVMDTGETPVERLGHVADVYRQYAHEHPAAYQLVFIQADAANLLPDNTLLVPMIQPVQALLVPLCGEEQSLAAIRGLLALLHGWVMLELANQLRRGGDLNAHYRQVVAVYLNGLKTADETE